MTFLVLLPLPYWVNIGVFKIGNYMLGLKVVGDGFSVRLYTVLTVHVIRFVLSCGQGSMVVFSRIDVSPGMLVPSCSRAWHVFTTTLEERTMLRMICALEQIMFSTALTREGQGSHNRFAELEASVNGTQNAKHTQPLIAKQKNQPKISHLYEPQACKRQPVQDTCDGNS